MTLCTTPVNAIKMPKHRLRSRRYHFRSIGERTSAGRLPGMKVFFCISILAGSLVCASALQPVNYVIDQTHDWPDVSEGIHSLLA